MKKYVFITGDIHPIGGLQLYVYGKMLYLRKNGWDVKILFSGSKKRNCDINGLNDYADGAFSCLTYSPNNLLRMEYNKWVKKIINYIGKDDTVLIESYNEVTAVWGELIASIIGAKHICFNCNEIFRGKNKYYEKYIEFMWHKYNKKELYGLTDDTISKIFIGHYDVKPSHDFWFDAVEADPIQDVSFNIDFIEKKDFNICYLGRTTKGYFPYIVEGIKKFADIHMYNSINFIIIGDAKSREVLLKDSFKNYKNVIVTKIGNMVPIPRIIYKKIDVVIAGAICAEVSARENIPTIVADCENFQCNGILGYTVFNSMYYDKNIGQFNYEDVLEDVLINKSFLVNQFSFPNQKSADEVYESHLSLFDECNNSNYYDIKKLKPLKMKFNKKIKMHFKLIFNNVYMFFLNRR